MRENRTYGSVGGESDLPYPIVHVALGSRHPWRSTVRCNGAPRRHRLGELQVRFCDLRVQRVMGSASALRERSAGTAHRLGELQVRFCGRRCDV